MNCIYQVYFDLKEPFLPTSKRLPHFSFAFRKMLYKYIIILMYFNVNDHLTRFTFESNSIVFYITYGTHRFITVVWNTWVAPKCWPLQQHPRFYILYLVLALYNHSVNIHYQVMLIWVCFVKMITEFDLEFVVFRMKLPKTQLLYFILGRFYIDYWSLVFMTT